MEDIVALEGYLDRVGMVVVVVVAAVVDCMVDRIGVGDRVVDYKDSNWLD